MAETSRHEIHRVYRVVWANSKYLAAPVIFSLAFLFLARLPLMLELTAAALVVFLSFLGASILAMIDASLICSRCPVGGSYHPEIGYEWRLFAGFLATMGIAGGVADHYGASPLEGIFWAAWGIPGGLVLGTLAIELVHNVTIWVRIGIRGSSRGQRTDYFVRGRGTGNASEPNNHETFV